MLGCSNMANGSGSRTFQGTLSVGLWGGLVWLLAWFWENQAYLAPLFVLAIAFVIRLGEWHLPFVPFLKDRMDSLTTPGDMRTLLPGKFAQDRLHLLLDNNKQDSGVRSWVAASETGLARWFGPRIWTPHALHRALTFAFWYPIASLLIVWAATGKGQLGGLNMLPEGGSMLRRLILLAALVMPGLIKWWLQRLAGRSIGWREFLFRSIAVAIAIAVGYIVFTVGHINELGLAFSCLIVATIVISSSVDIYLLIMSVLIWVGVVNFIQNSLVAFTAAITWYYVVIILTMKGPLIISFEGNKGGIISASLLLLMFLVLWIDLLTIPRLDIEINLRLSYFSYISVFYFCLLPTLNSIFDFISVGLTRTFLQSYLEKGTGWWWMVIADAASAVALTVFLLIGVLAAMLLMQRWGWGIEAAKQIEQFRADPTAPQVQWLTWMALTNVLPTLLHLSLACAGLWSGWLLKDAEFAKHLAELRQGPDSAKVGGEGASVQDEAALVFKSPLSKPQAAKLVNWIYVDIWLCALLPPALVVACWPFWQWLMQQAMRLLPV